MVEFHVLQCCDCKTFQVLQVTKSNKWKCKLCGTKQSVLKAYGMGSGADCRRHVQKLNSLRGNAEAQAGLARLQRADEGVPDAQEPYQVSINDVNSHAIQNPSSSKWSQYVDEESREQEFENENEGKNTGHWATSGALQDENHRFVTQIAPRKRSFERSGRSFKRNPQENPFMKKRKSQASNEASCFQEAKIFPSRNKDNQKNNFGQHDSPSSYNPFKKSTTCINPLVRSNKSDLETENQSSFTAQNSIKQNQSMDSASNTLSVKKKTKPKKSETSTNATSSKWGKFVDSDSDSSESDENDDKSDKSSTFSLSFQNNSFSRKVIGFNELSNTSEKKDSFNMDEI